MNKAEEARRLLDNEYSILLFKDGLGQYSAIAVPKGESADQCLEDWENYESPDDMPIADIIYDGPNRTCGCGLTVAEALHAVAEKVLLKRLPDRNAEREIE